MALAKARGTGDLPREIDALKSLHAVYLEMDRAAEAQDAGRRALALHLRMHGQTLH